ncbi:MAG: RNA polymerase sigma factor [Bacteroidota bacterium]
MKGFEGIIADSHAFLHKICLAYTSSREDYEDLYQEILVQVWQSLHRFKGESKLSTWVYRVALNSAIVFRRKQGKEAVGFLGAEKVPVTPLYEPTSKSEAIASDNRQLSDLSLMMESIRELALTDRSVLLLHLEEYSNKEIAEFMGINAKAVGVRISRAKKKLRVIMLNRGYGND